MSDRELQLRALYLERPRDRFVRASMAVLGIVMLASWLSGEFHLSDVFSQRRLANAERFAADVVPYSLRGEPLSISATAAWAGERLADGGAQAMLATVAISVAAIVLAALLGALACLPAARSFMSPDAFAPSARPPRMPARAASAAVVAGTRAVLIFVRAVPEYVWAFLLVKIFGFSAWPAVLALAIHNAGILGKLMAETVENCEPAPPTALRALGATRLQVALTAILPDTMPRFLLYFFYRWETCVREATVLGMLGVLSLGSLIRDARASNFYDEMLFYVMLGAALVLVGDLVSALARAALRRAG